MAGQQVHLNQTGVLVEGIVTQVLPVVLEVTVILDLAHQALLVDLTIHQAQLIQDLQDHQQWVVRHEVHLLPLLVQVVEVLDSN